jgi:uncharacterized protein YcbX
MSEVRGYVSDVALYPIKSCAAATFLGEQPTSLPVAETGFEYDREWMVARQQGGKMLTQRTMPKLAQVEVDVRDDHLLISVPGYGSVEAPLAYDAEAPEELVSVHSKVARGRDQGVKLAKFFSGFLGKDVKLMRASKESPRYIDWFYHMSDASNQVAFGDGFPFLLTSGVSLAAQHAVKGWDAGTVPEERFRANIRITGEDLKPYEEDYWKKIKIGNVTAYVAKACARCAMPSVHQSGENVGTIDEIDVLRDFLADRQGESLADPHNAEGTLFGQNINHIFVPGQTVSVGDRVRVLRFSATGIANVRLNK